MRVIIADRLLLLGVPEELLCKAVSLAGSFARDWNIAEHSGTHRAIGFAIEGETFMVWSSKSGRQICVRHQP